MDLDLAFEPATGTALATIGDVETRTVAQDAPALSQADKAAIVLVALGPDSASAILKEIGSTRLRRFARVLNDLDRVQNEVVDGVLAEFLDRLDDTQSVTGGKEETKRFLSEVLERDQVAQIMSDVESARRSVWSSLSDVDDARIAAWLQGEHPQVAAIALSRLTSIKAARVLEQFDAEAAQEIVLRLAQAQSASPDVAVRIGEVVEREFLPKARKSQESQDPSEMIGSMMNHISPQIRDTLLNHMTEEKPKLAEAVQKVMFTFENIVERVNPRDVGVISKSIDETVLLKALKGDDDVARAAADFFFGNMSKRLAERLREDLEAMDAPRKKDIEGARAEIVAAIVDLRDREAIEMIEPDEDEV